MVDENLISTLEQSLRQTRNAQTRLVGRLNEVEAEAKRLRQEIGALEKSAEQTEQAIYSLLNSIRSGKPVWDATNHLRVDEDYEIPAEIRRPPHINMNPPAPRQNYQNNYPQNYRDDDPHNYTDNVYRDNSVTYANKHRHSSPNENSMEPISNRFSDRTITQACTLLLRESGEPMHVNELHLALQANGFVFKGNNPTISIAVSLNRNRRFRKVAPGTFDLASREASQAAS